MEHPPVGLEHDGDGSVMFAPPRNNIMHDNFTKRHMINTADPFQKCVPEITKLNYVDNRVETALHFEQSTPGLNVIERNLQDLKLGQTKTEEETTQDVLASLHQFLLEVRVYMEQLYEQNDEGDTALHQAIIHQGESEFWSVLQRTYLQQYLDIQNCIGQTPLHLAIAVGQKKMARVLLACGANLTVQDAEGRTPLHIACDKADLEAIQTLTTPLQQNEVNNLAQVQYEATHSIIPQRSDIVNYEGEPCAYLAAKQGRIDIVDHLVNRCGHDINAQEQKGGKTILHLAVETDNEKMIEYLLRHPETEPHKEDYSGRSALQLSRYHPASIKAMCSVYPNLKNDLYELYAMDSSSDESDEDTGGGRLTSGD